MKIKTPASNRKNFFLGLFIIYILTIIIEDVMGSNYLVNVLPPPLVIIFFLAIHDL
ncbi:hypothetical protein [Pseudolactococcus hodotermopsidis]|uniref:hypothetical protein n=1 Tax=Pseudolactococcus hodotermopsidis TaxID=2709157 RepID=UPI001553DDF6|nr:hypothetical protein [Lactococcus hodotermopsidis]